MRKIYNLINHFEYGGKRNKFSPNKTGFHNVTKIWLIKSFSNFLKQNDILIFLDRFFYYFFLSLIGSFGHVRDYIMWTVTNYSSDWGPLCYHEIFSKYLTMNETYWEGL